MNTRTFFIAAALIAAPAIAFGQAGAGQAYMAVHEKMMSMMQGMKPSGDADKDFVMMMIPHHQGAIDMAKVELEYGKDPELKKMAQKIISDQEREIAEMKKWQSQNAK